MRRESFLVGTLVLVVASLVSRGLGALYRFIVPILMGGGAVAAVGMGLYQMAAPIYGVLLSASATGLPSAVARMVAARLSLDRPRQALGVFYQAFLLVALVGGAAALLLFFGAPFYAQTIAKDARATLTVQAIAPAAFFVSLASIMRGFLQGLRRMTPLAASQVVEQLSRVGSIVVLVVVLLPYGIEWAAAGVSLGATVGGLASLLYLVAQFQRVLREWPAAERRPLWERGALRELLGLAVPISFSYMVQPLVMFIDALVVPTRLHQAGLGAEATALYGYLSGFATPFMVLPTTFTAALAMNLLPALSELQARQDEAGIRRRLAAGLRLTFLLSFPSAAGLLVLATPIESAFFRAPQAGPLLAILSLGVLGISLQQVSAAALQGLGRPLFPMITLFFGGALKLLLTWSLTGYPSLNVKGAALATVLAFFLAGSLNLAFLHRSGYGVPWRQLLPGPLLASSLMGAGVAAFFYGFQFLWQPLGRGGEVLGLALAILLGMLLYGFMAGRLGVVQPSDVENLPRVGPRLVRLGYRLGLWP
ncbi:MAG: polysaccharide biosynthesis protein [Clostridiales bacterium]|nr:polysaccharide biosynthesis protein [Clostridiales bacterium]